ncbi:MAG: hypothetical protein CML03_01700 [Pseudooceanicola sp.]|nr:hypothetical protein [Pseudooceanicola sp.]
MELAMRRLGATAALCLSATSTLASGLDLTPKERAALGEEVRALLLAEPELVDKAINPPAPSLYSEYVQADLDRLEENADLFVATARGIGATDPGITILFFEDYPCASCGAAWADLETLVTRHPDIRVEPRFAGESGAAQTLLSLLDRQGAQAYHDAHRKLLAAGTEADLSAILDENRWPTDRMLRAEPRQEAAAFAALEMDSAPAYVLPRMMLQGAMPLMVLEKYLSE